MNSHFHPFFFSRYIFRIIVSIPFILCFNALLVGILFSIVNEGLQHECVTMIKNLRLETIASTLVVWGVVLESRDEISERIFHHTTTILPLEAHESIRFYGISLVAMGLVVEVMDYVNHQFQAEMFNLIALELTASVQWAILVIVLIDTCSISFMLFRCQFMRK